MQSRVLLVAMPHIYTSRLKAILFKIAQFSYCPSNFLGPQFSIHLLTIYFKVCSFEQKSKERGSRLLKSSKEEILKRLCGSPRPASLILLLGWRSPRGAAPHLSGGPEMDGASKSAREAAAT